MAYAERFPIMFPAGIHAIPLRHLTQLGLGVDDLPLHVDHANEILKRYGHQPDKEIVLHRDTGDDEADHNAVQYGKTTLQYGTGPFISQVAEFPNSAPHLAGAVQQLTQDGLIHPGEQVEMPVARQPMVARTAETIPGHDDWKTHDSERDHDTECPHCGNLVDDREQQCPHCGHDLGGPDPDDDPSDSHWSHIKDSNMQKGSPYPKNDDEVDHSAPGHNIPDKVNEIYNAVKREHPEYDKSKAMAIAWSRSGLKHEANDVPTGDAFLPGMDPRDPATLDTGQQHQGAKPCPHCGAQLVPGMGFCPGCGQSVHGGGGEQPQGAYPQVGNESGPDFGMYGHVATAPKNHKPDCGCFACEHARGGSGEEDETVKADLSPADEKEAHIVQASKWHVAFGDEQQATPVAPTQPGTQNGPYNSYDDVSRMSDGQERGFQNWVNEAVDHLNDAVQQGIEPDITTIASELSHGGCPDPQKAIMVAMQQPVDQNGLRTAPPTTDPVEPGGVGQAGPADQQFPEQMSGLGGENPSNGTFASVKVFGKKGHVLERYEDLYHVKHAVVGLEDGNHVDVHEDQLEPIAPDAAFDPAVELQAFMDAWPKVEPTHASVNDRMANIRTARQYIRRQMSNTNIPIETKAQFDDIDAQLQYEALNLGSVVIAQKDEDAQYLRALPAYRQHVATTDDGIDMKSSFSMYDGLVLSTPETVGPSYLERIHEEHPAILAAEMQQATRDNAEYVAALAEPYIDKYTVGYPADERKAHRERFVASVQKFAGRPDQESMTWRDQRCPQCNSPYLDDYTGPITNSKDGLPDPNITQSNGKVCRNCGWQQEPSYFGTGPTDPGSELVPRVERPAELDTKPQLYASVESIFVGSE